MIFNTLLTEKLKSLGIMKSCVDGKPNEVFIRSEVGQGNVHRVKDFEACIDNKYNEFIKHTEPRMIAHAKGLLNTLYQTPAKHLCLLQNAIDASNRDGVEAPDTLTI